MFVYIPAGLVEEKFLVWFLNAFESCKYIISIVFSSGHPRRGRRSKQTEGRWVNLRTAIEDMMKGVYQTKRERRVPLAVCSVVY